MIKYRVLTYISLLCLIGVSGCTTAELVKSAAQSVLVPTPKVSGDGIYKVGQPYEIEGKWYYPKEEPDYVEVGVASWYGDKFHRKATANGEIFHKYRMTAAHRTLPLPSIVKVTNLDNGKVIKVRVNDRGPFAKDRIIDLSEKAAKELGFHEKGTQRVRVEFDKKASEELPLVRIAKGNERLNPSRSNDKAKRVFVDTKRYYVQLGAFGDKTRALTMKGELDSIPAVFVEDAILRNSPIYKVKIGPVRDADNAEKLLAIVQNKGYVDAIIVNN